MNYTHLTQTERYQIYALRKAGQTQKQIAAILKRSESTICRELQRNTGGRGYRPKQTQKKAVERRAINAQPAVVEKRCRIGDWEADTLIGKNHRQAIVSLVERKSGLTLIVSTSSAPSVHRHKKPSK